MKTRTNSHPLQLKQSTSGEIVSELLAGVVELPQELVIEILLRLPVKSLLKFKCVSKSWLSLISSPQFIRSHFSTFESKEDHYFRNSQVFFTRLRPDGLKQFSLYSALNDLSANVSDIEFPSLQSGRYFNIIGIVNGLVCLLRGRDYLCLWNPVLRKSKRFPHPDFLLCIALGFGYDESNDDYKVVFVGRKDETVVMVYSLLTDSWRTIEDFKPRLPCRGFGKYANGKIHWTHGSSVHEMKIVSLDMVCDKYGELQRPDYETGVSGWGLGVLRGQLSMLCDHDRKKGDLWVMDIDESWSKVVSIPYGNVHPANSYFLPQVICVLRNGLVVLSTGSQSLLVYHSEHKEFRNIEWGSTGSHNFNFHLCVESLVLPAGFEAIQN